MKNSAMIVCAIMATAPTLSNNATTKSHLSGKGQRIESQKQAQRESQYYQRGGANLAYNDAMGQVLMNPKR